MHSSLYIRQLLIVQKKLFDQLQYLRSLYQELVFMRTVSCSNEASAVLILRDIPRRKVLKTYSEVSESRKANCITSRPFAVNIPSSSIRSLRLNDPYTVYAKNKAYRQQQQQ